MNFESWYNSTYQHCIDPTDFDNTNPKCCIDDCDNDVEYDDDKCDECIEIEENENNN